MKTKKLLLVFAVSIIVSTYSIGKYYEKIEIISENILFKPILVINSDEEICLNEIIENNFEYSFSLKNYNDQEINNIDLLYKIKIENNLNNSKIEYSLIDEDSGEIIEINNNETEYVTIGKEKTEKRFKLFINFNDEKLVNGNLKIRIEVIQQLS